jgi:acetaldehyde dehydrogenase (acetylating)
MEKINVVVLGSGNIGIDLLFKVTRSPYLNCFALVGRNDNSIGAEKAKSLGIKYSANSIQFVVDNSDKLDLVFDATSAKDHKNNAVILRELGIKAIDLTPAKVGVMAVPAINIDECISSDNINMITCGGQASVPIAAAIGRTHSEVQYIEVVSSIASKSAGPATRENLDEYIATTEAAIIEFSGAKKSKAILILNPALPCINMQTTIFAKVTNPNIDQLRKEISSVVAKIKTYVPGYSLLVEPLYENGRIVVMVRVHGRGDYLPEYAGNLDIINCAALAMAEAFAKQRWRPISGQ